MNCSILLSDNLTEPYTQHNYFEVAIIVLIYCINQNQRLQIKSNFANIIEGLLFSTNLYLLHLDCVECYH